MRDVASCVRNITGRITIMDRKRKLEMAGRLQLRWQRWEMTNYDYLMQASTAITCSNCAMKQALLPAAATLA
jgi:hypothetical protein